MIDILFSIIVVLFAYDGEEWIITEPISISFMEQGHPYCESIVACSFLEENVIFINISKLDRRDDCGRNPIVHELLHHSYDSLGVDIHERCDLITPLILLPKLP